MVRRLENSSLPARVTAREARANFAELTDRVRYTGAPTVVEKQGKPYVAIVPIEDVAELERLRAWERQIQFARLAMAAARDDEQGLADEAAVVAAVKKTRAELYRERYGR